MSTKTTIKRIALVAVSALGLGMVTTVAANAGDSDTSTSAFSLNASSFTIVGGGANDYGVIQITTKGNVNGKARSMFSGETIKATVISWPTAVDTTTAAGDIVFAEPAAVSTSTGAASGDAASASTVDTTASDGIIQYDNTNVDAYAQDGATAVAVSSTYLGSAAAKGMYFLKLSHGSSKALDKGEYTIRLDLLASGNVIQRSLVKVKWVTDKVDSGAVLANTVTSYQRAGDGTTANTVANTDDNSLAACLTDANGGLVRSGNNGIPALTATLKDAATTPVSVSLTMTDSGSENEGVGVNGCYEATAGNLATLTTAGTGSFQVRYGNAVDTDAVTILNVVSGTGGAVTLIADGVAATTTSTPYTLPLTTKTATIKVAGGTAGKAYSYTVAYTGVAAGDQTPEDSTPTTVYADSSGNVSAVVTNANPIDGASAVVTITGFASSNPAAQTLNWKKSAATTISVDNSGAYVALKSVTVFTATVTDAFGKPVSGVLLQPSLSSTSSNYSATAVYPTVTSGANGTATFTVTDAKAVAAGTDSVTFTQVVSSGTALTGSSTITYAATAPAPTSLVAYYDPNPTTATPVTPLPASGPVYFNGSTKFAIQKARNNSIANAAANTTDALAIRIYTAVAGAKVVATGSEGVYFLNSANLQVASSTKYAGSTGYAGPFVVGSSKTGTNTVTFTSGTVTTTVTFAVGNGAGDARFVTLKQASAGGAVVAQVTDRYGNGISGLTVQISTDAGTLGNGQLTTVYTTDLNGAVSFLPVGADSANITATLTDTTANDTASLAGFSGTTQIDSTVAAGNKTVTLAVSPDTTTTSTAVDAANEATDAANAATDAANAAAEAADAATAAAQDAQAAVAELATKVASLIAGIKAQITTLTNLVIKIQKKVRA